MVEQPMPSGRAKATTRELPMSQPRGRWTLSIGVESAVLEDLGGEASDAEPIVSLMHDTAGQCPMPDRLDHVLADSERGDRVLSREGRLGNETTGDRLFICLLEPH